MVEWFFPFKCNYEKDKCWETTRYFSHFLHGTPKRQTVWKKQDARRHWSLAPTRELARQIQLEATLTTTTGEKKSKTKVKVGGLMQHPRVVDGKKLPHLVLVLSPSKMEAWKTIRLPFKKLFLFRGHVNLRGVLYVFVAGMRMVLHMSKVLHCLWGLSSSKRGSVMIWPSVFLEPPYFPLAIWKCPTTRSDGVCEMVVSLSRLFKEIE